MKIKILLLVPVLVAVLALGAAAQDTSSPKAPGGNSSSSGSGPVEGYPEIELAAGFSFLCACPEISGFNRFWFLGGGVGAVYNIRSWMGIKGEFMGYTTTGGYKDQFIKLHAAGAGSAQPLHLHLRPAGQEAVG